jgi:hypothetical protein
MHPTEPVRANQQLLAKVIARFADVMKFTLQPEFFWVGLASRKYARDEAKE